ncbi:MAG: hypothetical protein ACRD1H_05335, partial [Vicinamibacterales bacterium]
ARTRRLRRRLPLLAVLALALGLFPAPAGATVHEIVGQWCAGRGELFPPGVSKPENQARPLFATGFASIVDPFAGPNGEGVLIAFDFDHPASKVASLGFFVQIGTVPDGRPLYIEAFAIDTSHGFTNCQRLRDL